MYHRRWIYDQSPWPLIFGRVKGIQNISVDLLQSFANQSARGTDLLLLLAGQLHLLPLLLQLRGGHLLLLVVGGEELLPQTDQLTNHGGELALLLLQRLGRSWNIRNKPSSTIAGFRLWFQRSQQSGWE